MAHANYAPLFQVERDSFEATRGAAATETRSATWTQSVEIMTRNGERWSAVYGFERTSDGMIAITSCVLFRRTDAST